MYHVFVRTWWKEVTDRYGTKKLVPHMGRKYTLAHVGTEQEARQICKEYNDTHNPGKLSRKAEYYRE